MQLRDRLRSRATQPWAAPALAALRADAAAAVARGLPIPGPDRASGWAHHFTCLTCAAKLRFSWEVTGPFPCAECGHRSDGDDHRAAWVYFAHNQLVDGARDACLLALLDGDHQPAVEHAHRLLLTYADAYLDYEVHGRWAGKGRLQGQSLCEAVTMLRFCAVYDLLVELGALTIDEHRLVQERMFRPAMELLRAQTHLVHNIHVWHAAALVAMGDRCGDDAMAGFGRHHIHHCLERGVLDDGSWYESSPHYHYYTIEALLAAVEACHRLGTPPPGVEVLRRMLRALLPLLRPDGHIALINDGWAEHAFNGRAAIYERAEGLVGGMLDVLGELYHDRGVARDGLPAVIHGPEAVPSGGLDLPMVAETDGVVTVRRGPWFVLVKANPHGGGHDHRDQPTLDLHLADGRLDAGDLGNPGYGNPLHQGWFKRTAAHNTVLADGADHGPARCRVLEAEDRGRYAVVRVRVRDAFADGEILRTVVVGDGWVVDRTIVVCAAPHRLLWRFHAVADLAVEAAAEASTWLDQPHLTDQRRFATNGVVDGAWTSAAGGHLGVRLWLPPGGGCGAGRGPALPATRHVDLLAMWTDADRAVFDACYTTDGVPAAVRCNAGPTSLFGIGGLELALDAGGRVLAPASGLS